MHVRMIRQIAILGLISAVASQLFAKGILLLTFDDRNLDSWCEAMPIFAEYGAHATFFPCGYLSDEDMTKIKLLVNAGHSVGTHTVSHTKVPQQIGGVLRNWRFWRKEIAPHEKMFSKYGLQLKYFAYPYNDYTKASDEMLCSKFALLRAGTAQQYARLNRNMGGRLDASGIGEYYETNIDEVCAEIIAIATNDKVLCLYSHAIYPDATSNNMKSEWLRKICETAKMYDVRVLSFEEFEDEVRR